MGHGAWGKQGMGHRASAKQGIGQTGHGAYLTTLENRYI